MYVHVRIGWLEETQLCQTLWGDARNSPHGWRRQKMPLAPYLSLLLTRIWKSSRYEEVQNKANTGAQRVPLLIQSSVDSVSYTISSDWAAFAFILCLPFWQRKLFCVAQLQEKKSNQVWEICNLHSLCFDQCFLYFYFLEFLNIFYNSITENFILKENVTGHKVAEACRGVLNFWPFLKASVKYWPFVIVFLGSCRGNGCSEWTSWMVEQACSSDPHRSYREPSQ